MRSILKNEMNSLEAMDRFFTQQNKERHLTVTLVGRLGGIKVAFIVNSAGKDRIMTVSRNELTRLAAQLVKKHEREGKKEATKSVVQWLKAIDTMAEDKIDQASSFRKNMRKIRRLSSNIAIREDILVEMCKGSKLRYSKIMPKDLAEERKIALEVEELKAEKARERRIKKKLNRKTEIPTEERTTQNRRRNSESHLYHVDTLPPEEAARILKGKLTGPLEGHRKYVDWRPQHRKPRPKAEGTIGRSVSMPDLGTFVQKDSPTGSVVIKDDKPKVDS
jgi:hypothetical protein